MKQACNPPGGFAVSPWAKLFLHFMYLFFPFRQAVAIMALGLGCMAAAQAGGHADTLNQVDQQGRKQGWWKTTGPVADKPDYDEGVLYEEGRYLDNRRTGTWKRYWPSGKPRTVINYVKGFPKGEYTLFYPDGKQEEKGTWDLDRNTGTFKRWHPNGNVAQDFVFDAYGTRNGVQRYYYENGQLEVEVEIVKGREEGVLKRYYPNGDLQETARFNAGAVEDGSFRNYAPKGPVVEIPPPPDAVAAPAKDAQESPNAAAFDADGWNTLYDGQHRLSKQGLFRKGRLWNGKVYKYDANGILYRIEVYANGRYAGKALLTDDDR